MSLDEAIAKVRFEFATSFTWAPTDSDADTGLGEEPPARITVVEVVEEDKKTETRGEEEDAKESGPEVTRWHPDLDCNGLSAGARVQWLVNERGRGHDDAKMLVMSESPDIFSAWTHIWNPHVICTDKSGSHDAAARVQWLVKNTNVEPDVARQRIMAEFPSNFSWNPYMQCKDGTGVHLAGKRADWLCSHAGMSLDEAIAKVRFEFATSFTWAPTDSDADTGLGEEPPARITVVEVVEEDKKTETRGEEEDAKESGPEVTRWHPDLDCNGLSAGARVQWLVNEGGRSRHDAKMLVMGESPHIFSAWTHAWNPHEICTDKSGSHAAAARAEWLVKNTTVDPDVARQRIMAEFSGNFSWNPYIQCKDDTDMELAGKRADWLCIHKEMNQDEARAKVIAEFPASFASCPSDSEAEAGLGGECATPLDGFGPLAVPAAQNLVWTDNFDYEGAPDSSKWTYDVGAEPLWGNKELQNYTERRSNCWVSGGTLKIRALREDFEGSRFTSARLVSRGLGDWLFGRVEVRARLPTARGSWAAIWMLPTDRAFGAWPKSGEIDILEHVGHNRNTVHSTVHTEDFNHHKKTQKGGSHNLLGSEVSDWHEYAVEWNEFEIAAYIDGHEYVRFKNDCEGRWQTWPFNQRFHLILNVAVGGTWGGQKGVDEQAFENDGQVMEIDWVRVYQ